MHQSIDQASLALYVAMRSTGVAFAHRLRSNERGEGVISAAIAILVMAFLGVALWVTFKDVFTGVKAKTEDQLTQIGQ